MGPFSPIHLLLLVIVLGFFFFAIQVGIFSIALDKLGLSSGSALLIIASAFIGSLINLPLGRIKSEFQQPPELPSYLRGWLRFPQGLHKGYTLISVNVGGCLIPLLVCVYILQHQQLDWFTTVAATAFMSFIAYSASRPVPGLGVGMPIFVAPLAAAIIALVLAPENSAALAFVSGTLGVIIGADLLRLKDIRHLGTPAASIGGAGTFDGIFLTGIMASLLA